MESLLQYVDDKEKGTPFNGDLSGNTYFKGWYGVIEIQCFINWLKILTCIGM